MKYLKHPFGQAVLVLFLSYLLLKWGIEYLPPLVGIASAPVPEFGGVPVHGHRSRGGLLWVSDNEARWTEFKEPIHRVMVDPDQRILRSSLMLLAPILVAFATFNQVRPSIAAPSTLRSIHPVGSGPVRLPGDDPGVRHLGEPPALARLPGGALRRGEARLLRELPGLSW